MVKSSRPLMVDRFLKGKGPIKPRNIALLMMIAGAVSFIVSLVSYSDQALCLFGSTLVVFAGLGINIAARRYLAEGVYQEDLPEEPQPLAEDSAVPLSPSRLEGEVTPGYFTRRTIDILRGMAAEVKIVNQREDRSILHVISTSGKGYSILIYEGAEIIDIKDIRGLYSLMVSSGAEGAIFVSAGSFSTPAQEWAQKRAVLLLEGSRVEEIEI